MYIVAIGWMYVVTLMAATENSVAAGVATFLFYGVLPCSVLVYIMGTKNRRLRREFQELQAQRTEADTQKSTDVYAPESAELITETTAGVSGEQGSPSVQLDVPTGPPSDGKTTSNP